MTDEKIRENRLRRMAERQGLTLKKSRRRDEQAWDYGTYTLLDDPRTGTASGFLQGIGLNLDEVEDVLLVPIADLPPDPVVNNDWEYLDKVPDTVPEGRFLVHNRVQFARWLNARGFRAWLTADPDRLMACDCKFAPGLVHHRMRPLADREALDVEPRGETPHLVVVNDDPDEDIAAKSDELAEHPESMEAAEENGHNVGVMLAHYAADYDHIQMIAKGIAGRSIVTRAFAEALLRGADEQIDTYVAEYEVEGDDPSEDQAPPRA